MGQARRERSNPSFEARPNGKPTRPGPVVRRTFSPARAWRLAVGPASTRTLGVINTRSTYCGGVLVSAGLARNFRTNASCLALEPYT